MTDHDEHERRHRIADSVAKWTVRVLVAVTCFIVSTAATLVIRDRAYILEKQEQLDRLYADHEKRLAKIEGNRYTTEDALRDRVEAISKNTSELREIRDTMAASLQSLRESIVRLETKLEKGP